MLLALAVLPPYARPDTAILQLVGHAAFKSLLFLMVGWLAVLAGSVRAERMAGVVRRFPHTRRLTAVGLLALAAVPLWLNLLFLIAGPIAFGRYVIPMMYGGVLLVGLLLCPLRWSDR